MPFSITLATTPAQRDAVFRLRYEVLVEEGGQSPALADHHLRVVEEPADATARFLIATRAGVVVGAWRVNFLGEGELEDEVNFFETARFPEAHPHAVAFTAPPLVAGGLRNAAVPRRLALAAYGMNLDEGITHDFVACPPEHEVLFRDLGYRPYRGRVRDPERGRLMPMVLVLRDRAHLEEIRSPLLACLLERQHVGGRG